MNELNKRIITATITGVLTLPIIYFSQILTLLLIVLAWVIMIGEAIYVWDISWSIPKRNLAVSLWIIYISICSFCIAILNRHYVRTELVAIILMVSLAQISAFVVGKIIGGPKIFPIISPNKTISGTLGGLLLVPLILIVLEYPLYIILSSFIIAVFEFIGDIIESMYKRCMDVKVTSNLLPGHGGVTDRLDGLMFVALCMVILF